MLYPNKGTYFIDDCIVFLLLMEKILAIKGSRF